MENGFQSQIEDIGENVKEIVMDTAAISKNVYESIESKEMYSSMSLDEQLINEIQEMKEEQIKNEELKQSEEVKEETKEEESKNKEDEPKMNEVEHER